MSTLPLYTYYTEGEDRQFTYNVFRFLVFAAALSNIIVISLGIHEMSIHEFKDNCSESNIYEWLIVLLSVSSVDLLICLCTFWSERIDVYCMKVIGKMLSYFDTPRGSFFILCIESGILSFYVYELFGVNCNGNIDSTLLYGYFYAVSLISGISTTFTLMKFIYEICKN